MCLLIFKGPSLNKTLLVSPRCRGVAVVTLSMVGIPWVGTENLCTLGNTELRQVNSRVSQTCVREHRIHQFHCCHSVPGLTIMVLSFPMLKSRLFAESAFTKKTGAVCPSSVPTGFL